jgi:hypothetical protein
VPRREQSHTASAARCVVKTCCCCLGLQWQQLQQQTDLALNMRMQHCFNPQPRLTISLKTVQCIGHRLIQKQYRGSTAACIIVSSYLHKHTLNMMRTSSCSKSRNSKLKRMHKVPVKCCTCVSVSAWRRRVTSACATTSAALTLLVSSAAAARLCCSDCTLSLAVAAVLAACSAAMCACAVDSS